MFLPGRAKTKKSVLISLIFLFTWISACQYQEPDSSPIVEHDKPDWYSIHFTLTNKPTPGNSSVDRLIVDAIDRAKIQIDIAIYKIDLKKIGAALIKAHDRGVLVRLVVESDNIDEWVVQELLNAGIGVHGDQRSSLMHNKFTIIDRREIWTGSMNYTSHGVYQNNNNIMRISSPELARTYEIEFEEMFIDEFFGDDILSNIPAHAHDIEGVIIECYFSPDDNTETQILDIIETSRESIFFMMYSFTSDPIADLLIKKHNEGIKVNGVIEKSQAQVNMGGEFQRLLDAGINVRYDGNHNMMHHKVIIVDQEIVITGSYNLSASAEQRNDENTLIIFDEQIASIYLKEYNRLFNEGD